jgi:DNA-binding transcriptional regulator LsrR (DeoR family)
MKNHEELTARKRSNEVKGYKAENRLLKDRTHKNRLNNSMVTVELLVKIARLYYEEGKTQEKIAEELGLNRFIIIQLLKRVKSEGIVRIEIVDPTKDFLSLEHTLTHKYGLKKVIVVPGNKDDSSMLLGNLGKNAASYLNEIVKSNDILGIGWGLSVLETTNRLKDHGNRAVTVVPLIGGGNESSSKYEVNELAKKISMAFGGNYCSLYIPALVDSKEIRDAVVSDSTISRIFDYWKRLNVILIGIGAMSSVYPDAFRSHLATHPIDFKSKDIVGDILSRFYNIKGENISLEMHDRMVGIDFKTMKKVDTVIGVAGGLDKYFAILGAIKGGIVNVLITDETVAKKLAAELPGDDLVH